jgi:CheY-like chemotaxis protein
MKDDDRTPPDAAHQVPDASANLIDLLSQKIVGQTSALRFIVPYVQMFQAGLAPPNRPVGVFLLLGPTGTGKTKTVQALAEILHGSEKNVVRVDCGEFQMEHEIAKLIGAPPGYLGHRETESLLNQQRLTAATSEKCEISVVLFDEIEKAAPTVTRLLLGILDNGILRLGDNTEVNFEKSLIFFTSNLGAREMIKELKPQFGFRTSTNPEQSALVGRLETVALAAVRKMYSPEFVNRIDAVITYQPLDAESFSTILDHQIMELQNHVNTRLGDRCFNILVPEDSRQFLLEKGTSMEFGARELKRTLHKYLTQPLASLVIEAKVEPGSTVRAELSEDKQNLMLRVDPQEAQPSPATRPTTILIVDDNKTLMRLLSYYLNSRSSWKVVTATSVQEANQVVKNLTPDIALLDYLLPDGNGVRLGVHLMLRSAAIKVIIMTGLVMPTEELEACKEYGFPILEKPFLAEQILQVVKDRLQRSSTVSA